MNRTTVKRKIFGYLEYIAELGGLAGALGSVCRAFIAILQFRALHQFLTPYLFAISQEVKKEDRFMKPNKEGADGATRKQSVIPLALRLGAGMQKIVAGQAQKRYVKL